MNRCTTGTTGLCALYCTMVYTNLGTYHPETIKASTDGIIFKGLFFNHISKQAHYKHCVLMDRINVLCLSYNTQLCVLADKVVARRNTLR